MHIFGKLQLVLNGMLLGLSIPLYILQHHTNDLLVMGWAVAWILIGWRLTRT